MKLSTPISKRKAAPKRRATKTKRFLSDLTIERLRVIASRIKDEPELYDQASVDCIVKGNEGRCGRPGCILGWAAYLWPEDTRGRNIDEQGGWALGFNMHKPAERSASDRLFLEWPEKFGLLWNNTSSRTLKHATVGVSRIAHFIKTDGKE